MNYGWKELGIRLDCHPDSMLLRRFRVACPKLGFYGELCGWSHTGSNLRCIVVRSTTPDSPRCWPCQATFGTGVSLTWPFHERLLLRTTFRTALCIQRRLGFAVSETCQIVVQHAFAYPGARFLAQPLTLLIAPPVHSAAPGFPGEYPGRCPAPFHLNSLLSQFRVLPTAFPLSYSIPTKATTTV